MLKFVSGKIDLKLIDSVSLSNSYSIKSKSLGSCLRFQPLIIDKFRGIHCIAFTQSHKCDHLESKYLSASSDVASPTDSIREKVLALYE